MDALTILLNNAKDEKTRKRLCMIASWIIETRYPGSGLFPLLSFGASLLKLRSAKKGTLIKP